jgi:hypothetical protein
LTKLSENMGWSRDLENLSWIQIQGSKKVRDPGSGSATLLIHEMRKYFFSTVVFANVDLVVCELHGSSLAPQHVARLIRNVVFRQHNPLSIKLYIFVILYIYLNNTNQKC